MITIRRFLSSWQGLAAGVVALALYLILPDLIRRIDPTAGVFDAGILHVIGLAMLMAFLGVFVSWACWQLAFCSVDRAADEHLDAWFSSLPVAWRYAVVQGTFSAMLLYWLACLWFAMRIAS